MKNVQGIIKLLFVWAILLNAEILKASPASDEIPDEKKLKSLQIKRTFLQLPLKSLQLLLMDNPFQPGKKQEGTQYLALDEARGIGECHYFFSIQVDLKMPNPEEHYGTYLRVLGNEKYKDKIISPLTMRVLGAYGREDKDYYQGTYEIRHEDLHPFRFHILAIEQGKAEKMKHVAFYLLNSHAKQGSTQLSALCKEEYALTKEGKFLDKTGKLIEMGTERWFSLEEVIGEKILKINEEKSSSKPSKPSVEKSSSKPSKTPVEKIAPKPSEPAAKKLSPKPKNFIRRPKTTANMTPSSSVEPKDSVSQTRAESSPSFKKEEAKLPAPSSSDVREESPSSVKKKSHFSYLHEEGADILESFQYEMMRSKTPTPQAESSSSGSASRPLPVEEIPTSSPSTQDSGSVQTTKGRTSSPSLNRGRNPAFVEVNAEQLLAGKKK